MIVYDGCLCFLHQRTGAVHWCARLSGTDDSAAMSRRLRTSVHMCEQTTGAVHWRHDVGAPVFADAGLPTRADDSQLLLIVSSVHLLEAADARALHTVLLHTKPARRRHRTRLLANRTRSTPARHKRVGNRDHVPCAACVSRARTVAPALDVHESAASLVTRAARSSSRPSHRRRHWLTPKKSSSTESAHSYQPAIVSRVRATHRAPVVGCRTTVCRC